MHPSGKTDIIPFSLLSAKSCTVTVLKTVPIHSVHSLNIYCTYHSTRMKGIYHFQIFGWTWFQFEFCIILICIFCQHHTLNIWHVMKGLARRLRRHSHCNPSRADQNQTKSDRLSLRSSTDAPFVPLHISWQPNPFRSLHVTLNASLLSWGLSIAFVGSLLLHRVLCEVRIKYMTRHAWIGQTS